MDLFIDLEKEQRLNSECSSSLTNKIISLATYNITCKKCEHEQTVVIDKMCEYCDNEYIYCDVQDKLTKIIKYHGFDIEQKIDADNYGNWDDFQVLSNYIDIDDHKYFGIACYATYYDPNSSGSHGNDWFTYIYIINQNKQQRDDMFSKLTTCPDSFKHIKHLLDEI